MGKLARKIRLQNFNKHVLDGLKAVYHIEKRDNGSFSIHTEDYGILDLYPKANKLLFRKDNKWINNGIDWVCNNL